MNRFLLAPVFLALAYPQVSAQTPEALPEAGWQARLAQGKALKEEGRAKKAAASALLDSENQACLKRFRVYDCQAEARERYLESFSAGRRLENEGAAIERQVKQERRADKDQRYEEAAPQRAADLKAREEKTRAARQAAETRRAERQAKQARQAGAPAQPAREQGE